MKAFPKRKTFEAWLRRQPVDVALAERWGLIDCPLCCFLIDAGYTTRPFIGPDLSCRPGEEGLRDHGVWRDDAVGTGPQRLPEWANDFSRGIDRAARVRPFGRGAPFYRAVTAGDCLWVLACLDREGANSSMLRPLERKVLAHAAEVK